MTNKLVDFLVARNAEQSRLFTSPDAILSRRLYRSQHPTEIAVLKCMDGRLNLPVMTGVPTGILQPFRNIGGQFDLGWPLFGVLMREWVEYCVHKGRHAVVLVTHHFSKGDHHRGCKGFSYDTSTACTAARGLKNQFETVFGQGHAVVHPIHVGIETDEDALTIYGEDGAPLDLAEETPLSESELRMRLERLFPDMLPQVMADLIPVLMGNQRHIAKLRNQERTPVDIQHREWILGIGRGFDWLHMINTALIVGPFSYDLADPIGKAAGILLDNLKSGRISEENGVVVLASGVYRDQGIERLLAAEKARSLSALAVKTVHERVPELVPYMRVVAGSVDLNTRLMTQVSVESSEPTTC